MAELDAIQEKIQQWRAAHKEPPRDFDFEMLRVIIDDIDGDSVVKIACNPLDNERNWVSGTICRNVGKVDVDEEGRLVLSVRHDNTEFTADDLGERIEHLRERRPGNGSNVMAKISDSKSVRITDVYSHALLRDSWAGLPFDLVLAYYEED